MPRLVHIHLCQPGRLGDTDDGDAAQHSSNRRRHPQDKWRG